MTELREKVILKAKNEYERVKREEYLAMIRYKIAPSKELSKELWMATNAVSVARSELENLLRENVYRRQFSHEDPVHDFWGPSRLLDEKEA